MVVKNESGITVIIAEEDMIICDSNNNPIGQKVYLGCMCNPEDYVEVEISSLPVLEEDEK